MRSSKVLSISVPPTLWEEIGKLAEKEKMTRSELLRVAAREFIRSRRWLDLREKGSRTALKFAVKTEEDVDRVLHEVGVKEVGRPDTGQTIRKIREFRKGITLGDISIRELIEAGRRF